MITIEQQVYFNNGQTAVTHYSETRTQFDTVVGWRIRKNGSTLFSSYPPFKTKEEAEAFRSQHGI